MLRNMVTDGLGSVHRWSRVAHLTNADNRLPLTPLAQVQGRDGVVEGSKPRLSQFVHDTSHLDGQSSPLHSSGDIRALHSGRRHETISSEREARAEADSMASLTSAAAAEKPADGLNDANGLAPVD